MTAPTTTQQPPPLQPPAQPSGLSAAQLAALLALIQAQSDVRLRLTQTAIAAVLQAFDALGDWWNPAAINRTITEALRVVQPTQAQAARVTDAYMARALSIMTGSRVDPVGQVDVRKLRRALPDRVAHDLVDGRRKPGYVIIGDTTNGAHDTINDPVPLTVRDVPKQQIEYVAPSDPYGRAVDQYRFDVVAKGVPEEKAKEKAKLRLAIVAQTDVTLAVREMYEKGLKRREIRGWRRIVHPEKTEHGPCGLCVVAASRVYAREDLMPLHDRCVCEVLPVVVKAGVELDPGYELDTEQLKVLYAAAGGTGGNPLRQEGRLKDVKVDLGSNADRGAAAAGQPVDRGHKVAIAEHAELGAVLVNADQHFRGPVEVARKKVKAKEPAKDLRQQLDMWESTYNKLLVRVAEGEDLDRTMDFIRGKTSSLRMQLGLPQADLPRELVAV